MRLAYVALQYDYGEEDRGPSYETDNLEAGFRVWSDATPHEVEYFHPDVDGEMDDLAGQLDTFDAIFHVAFNETIDLPLDVAQRAIALGKRVIQWDCDASWRFPHWIVGRRHRVTDFVTTHSCTIPWYRQHGMRVVRSQWGGSPLYQPDPDAEKLYDVSFVGQKHGIRPQIMEALYNAGIEVHLFGNYWDGYPNWHGYLPSTEDKVRAINQSKVCLNLSNPHQVGTMPQIKGRHFELPQCGAFQISTPADDLSSYFEDGKEIVVVQTAGDLVEAIKNYLADDAARLQVAEAGRARMLSEHQWEHRFQRMFGEMRLL